MASNEAIDAANGDGDAADDPASAGGEVASGVAALAVRYGIGCALAIVTFSSSAVHVCGGQASLAKRLIYVGPAVGPPRSPWSALKSATVRPISEFVLLVLVLCFGIGSQ